MCPVLALGILIGLSEVRLGMGVWFSECAIAMLIAFDYQPMVAKRIKELRVGRGCKNKEHIDA